MRCRILFAVVFVGVVWAPRAVEGANALSTRITNTLAVFNDRYGFPCATAAVALRDGTVMTAATGFADIEAGQPMTLDSRMPAASVGKSVVAAPVLALESEGALSQDDLLARHLGECLWFADLPNASSIKLGHLLRHQSGLPDHPRPPELRAAAAVRIANKDPILTPEEEIGFVTGRAPLFERGITWAYSDTGYVLLGMVIEDVTGTTYYEVAQERFRESLGLSGTIPYGRTDVPGLTVGYTIADNPFGLPKRTADVDARPLWDAGVEWTGGGLASTSHDLARWGNALYGGAAVLHDDSDLVPMLGAVLADLAFDAIP